MDVLPPEELLAIGDFHAEFESRASDKVIIRANLKTQADAEAYLRAYSHASNTNFIVADPMSSTPTRYLIPFPFTNESNDPKKTKNLQRRIGILF